MPVEAWVSFSPYFFYNLSCNVEVSDVDNSSAIPASQLRERLASIWVNADADVMANWLPI